MSTNIEEYPVKESVKYFTQSLLLDGGRTAKGCVIHPGEVKLTLGAGASSDLLPVNDSCF